MSQGKGTKERGHLASKLIGALKSCDHTLPFFYFKLNNFDIKSFDFLTPY